MMTASLKDQFGYIKFSDQAMHEIREICRQFDYPDRAVINTLYERTVGPITSITVDGRTTRLTFADDGAIADYSRFLNDVIAFLIDSREQKSDARNALCSFIAEQLQVQIFGFTYRIIGLTASLKRVTDHDDNAIDYLFLRFAHYGAGGVVDMVITIPCTGRELSKAIHHISHLHRLITFFWQQQATP